MIQIFQFLLGLILLLAPFSMVFFFQNRLKAFIYIFISLVFFHIILPIATQYLGIFKYSIIISISSIFTIAPIIFLSLRNRPDFKFKINWFLIVALLIIFSELWIVHFNYTGEVNTILGPKTVQNDSYAYPIFSDEWIAVSLANYSIKNHSLPLVNPLWENSNFLNPMFPYFSFISEIFLIFNVNPLTAIVYFSIISSLLICFLTFLLLKSFGLGNTASVVSIMFLPFVVNGANLPGLWYAMPFLISYIMFLLCLISLNIKERFVAILSGLCSFVLYPPMIVFLAPIILMSLIFEKQKWSKDEYLKNKIIISVGFILVVAIVFCFKFLSPDIFKAVYSFVFRDNLDDGIPSFAVWNVVPKIVLLFAIIGIFISIKKRIFTPLIALSVGLIFWVFYSYTNKVFIIDYPRVVVITSFIIILLSGFSFDWLAQKIKDSFFAKKSEKKNIKYVKIILLLFSASFIFFYTKNDDWKKMILVLDNGKTYEQKVPASPINRYLHPDDLRLFKGIEGKKFIAPAWKGLVVGVATNNFPLESKASTLGNKRLEYNFFLSADCGFKKELARAYNIDYVYSSNFECAGFSYLGSSAEGLNLYKYYK